MPDESVPREAWITLGRIAGAYGVRGWLRIASYAEPRAGILDYPRWWLTTDGSRREYELIEGRRHRDGVVAKLAGIDDRDGARVWLGAEITVPRRALAPTEGYYWADLIGLAVENRDGVALGCIAGHIETGGHDVIVVNDGERERLIPYAPGV
ncbi:MAG: ribosome maturation factor RimM, partial [Gammaproteobacteria bacterium]